MTSLRFSRQAGAALITVLMIVAAMSAVAVTLSLSVTTATERARLLDAQGQLRFYAIAAEDAAKKQISDLLQAVGHRLSSETPGLDEPQTFPINDGLITVTANDATNCFNVNSLVSGSPEAGYVINEDNTAIFQSLLSDLDIDRNQAQSLANALIDWMDRDSIAGLGGAEEGYYSGEQPAYRPSSLPIANLTELRAIRGYSDEMMEVLRPLICGRPIEDSEAGLPLNLNTLSPDQAPLLSSYLGETLDLNDARRVIEERPLGGWPDIESFVSDTIIADIAPEKRNIKSLGLLATHIEVFTEIIYRDESLPMRFVFEAQPGQPVVTRTRERLF